MDTQPGLKLFVQVPETPVRLQDRCPVRIKLSNVGSVPAVVNKRMAVGYRDSLSREIFADLVDVRTGLPPRMIEVDYTRNFSPPSDYVDLAPGGSITGEFDLFEWYAPVAAGTFRLVVHYQADEPLARAPADMARGVHSSDPQELRVFPVAGRNGTVDAPPQ